jgi:hypothetical protein
MLSRTILTFLRYFLHAYIQRINMTHIGFVNLKYNTYIESKTQNASSIIDSA